MATFDYQEMIECANELIEEFGTTYQVRGGTVYDPDELENVPGADRQVAGVVTDQETALQLAGRSGFLDSATWIAKKTLVMEADANPQPGEEVQVDGKWFPLSKAMPIKPADLTVVYLLDVTR